MNNIAKELVLMDIENTLNSKVNGRRNWLIRIETRTSDEGEKRIIRYHGAYGEGLRRGALRSCFVRDIVKNKIRWYKFTYKKDYEEALKLLRENGFIG